MATAKNSNEITSERELQVAIYDDPSILDGAWPEGDLPRWVFIRREMDTPVDSIPEHNLLLDFLLVDAEARPTLVETKLSSSTETRRTIVGQLLEYAAHAKGWDINDLRYDYEDPDDARLRILNDIPSPKIYASADDFWRRLCENLRDSRMNLVFAADDFPQETKAIAEFLDAVTKDDLSVRICAPNDINLSSTRPRRPSRRRPSIYVEERALTEAVPVEDRSFNISIDADLVPLINLRHCRGQRGIMTPGYINSLLPEEARDALHQILSTAHHAGACLRPRSQSLIICVDTPAWSSPVNIGWLDPPESSSYSWGKAGAFTFGYAGDIFKDDSLPGDRLYATLEQFAVSIAELGQRTPRWDSETTRAHAVPYPQAVDSISQLCECLMKVISELQELESEEPNGTRPDLEPAIAPPPMLNQQGLGEALMEALRQETRQDETG